MGVGVRAQTLTPAHALHNPEITRPAQRVTTSVRVSAVRAAMARTM